MRQSVKAGRRGALVGVLVALALVLLVGDPAGSTGTATIRGGSAEGASGTEVMVRLEALGVPDPGLGAFTIDVTYDPTVASPVGCQEDPGGIFDTVLCNINYRPNSVRVGGFRASSGATGSAPLADLTFRLVGQAGTCGSLAPAAVEFVDTETKPIVPLDLVSGSLCIKGTSGGSTPSGATPAVAAHPEGPSATPGAGAGLPPAAATSATPGAAGESQAGGAAGTASPSADQESTGAAAPGTPGPTQMAASAPTSVTEAAGSGKSPIATEESDGGMLWIIAIASAGAIIGAMSTAYFVYRRLRRQTS